MIKYLIFTLYSLLTSQNIFAQTNNDSLLNKTYTIVEEMPYLKTCEKEDVAYKSKKSCSDRELLSYLMSNIKLDTFDLYYSICCNAHVSFTINEIGQIEEIVVEKGVNENFDSRLVKLIKNLPEWIPGKHKGKNVKVRMILPIKIHPRID